MVEGDTNIQSVAIGLVVLLKAVRENPFHASLPDSGVTPWLVAV